MSEISNKVKQAAKVQNIVFDEMEMRVRAMVGL